MNDDLINSIIDVIYAEALARYRANACDPYDHTDYEAHEKRIDRLVTAIADGDDELNYRFSDALFDITHDRAAWARQTFFWLRRDLAAQRAETEAELAMPPRSMEDKK